MYDFEVKEELKELVISLHKQRMERETIEKYIDKVIVAEVFEKIKLDERIDNEKKKRENRITFELTKNHLKLLQRFVVGWSDTEYGAPVIDCKRPYGNSDVEDDIRDILKRKMTGSQCRDIHEDLKIALEILLRNGKIKTGNYFRNDEYSRDWSLVDPK